MASKNRKYKGVTMWRKTRAKIDGTRENSKTYWWARYQHQGIRLHIGYYETAVEAARAYDVVAMQMHGNAGRLNFPDNAGVFNRVRISRRVLENARRLIGNGAGDGEEKTGE